MDIQEARKKIDTIDALLAENYKNVLKLLQILQKYKDEHQMPLIDEVRDTDIIATHTNDCSDEKLRPYIEAYMSAVVSMSNEYLREHMHQHIFSSVCQGQVKQQLCKALSKELNRDFYDLDLTIQEKQVSIQNIIIYDGEGKIPST